MPEIITQLISMLIKIPLITLLGQLLGALLPDVLLPNSGTTPEVPIVPGITPPKTEPAPPCKCPKASFLELDSRLEAANPPSCACARSIPRDGSMLIETESQDPTTAGGSNGGPIAKIEPKIRDAVVDGLVSNCMPALQQDIAAKVIKLWPRVKYSVWRGAMRGLSHSLTKAVTQSLLQALTTPIVKSIHAQAVDKLLYSLLPGLTNSLSQSLAHTLTRNSKADYYCYMCSHHRLYCKFCGSATLQDYNLNYYSTYYATYYSSYYSNYYRQLSGNSA